MNNSIKFHKCNSIECSSAEYNQISCISLSNQECKVRPEIVNVTSNKHIFYPFSFKTSKCSGSCNINDPYARTCVPDVVKNLKVKVFHLMSRTNETRYIEWHETCKCECGLDAIVYTIINNIGIMINVDVNAKN